MMGLSRPPDYDSVPDVAKSVAKPPHRTPSSAATASRRMVGVTCEYKSRTGPTSKPMLVKVRAAARLVDAAYDVANSSRSLDLISIAAFDTMWP